MSYISNHTDIENARFTGHVWRSGGGTIHATVDLSEVTGHCWLSFSNPADARTVAAACTEAAEAMDRLAATTP